jgi:hypothetical protein
MLSRHLFPRNRPRLLGLIVVGAVVTLAGCGDSEKAYAVSGKVTVGGAPLTAGTVTFVPEGAAKTAGNPMTTIKSDGTYTMAGKNNRGLPAGRYKVAVTTMVPPGAEVTSGDKPPKPVAINEKYKFADSSGLSVEVVEHPAEGQYDLKLK